MNNEVVIIGAGISGLSTAFFLKEKGFKVSVLEVNQEVGGTMKSRIMDGYLIEYGPNSALETTPLLKNICRKVGILDQMIYANESSKKRCILREGRLHPLPLSVLSFIFAGLWSFKGKMRLLLEPFYGRAKEEESIAQFVKRRLGREFLDYAINPFVAGVYAGNPECLSVRMAFPKLYALEEKHGGLIVGTIKGAFERRRRVEKAKITAKMFSFLEGMGTFPKAIASYLGSSVCTNAKATDIAKSRDKLIVSFKKNGKDSSLTTNTLVISTPAYQTPKLTKRISPKISNVLNQIHYPPLCQVVLGYQVNDLGLKPDGFGFLVPQKEKRDILGTIFSSSIFPKRSPDGYVELTTFVGGTRTPELALRSDQNIIQTVKNELTNILKIKGNPEFVHLSRWQNAIPQYNLGYDMVHKAIEEVEKEHPGLYFCANYLGGIAVGDCIMSAQRTAEKVQRKKDTNNV